MNGRNRTADPRWLALGVAAASALAVALTGCGGSSVTGTASSSAPAAPATAAAASSAPAASAASGGGSAGGALDPCQVITVAEASQLVGQTLKQASNSMLTCVYTAGGSLVTVTVRRMPGSSLSLAQEYYDKAVNQFGSEPGVVLTHPGVGDRSLGGSLNQGGLSMSVLAFLKGAVYVGIVAKPGPGAAAMKSIAMTALGRV
ncbi:MAG: DUF3558 family protein [Gemmatimonadota bacterium]